MTAPPGSGGGGAAGGAAAAGAASHGTVVVSRVVAASALILAAIVGATLWEVATTGLRYMDVADPARSLVREHDAAHSSRKQCLVIVMFQTRAHTITWPTFKRNLLDQLQCDLALCVGRNMTAQPRPPANDPFYQTAKYIWEYPEPEDYGPAFDYAAATDGAPPGAWREVLKVVNNTFFGCIKDPNHWNVGSGAVMLFYRWFLLHNLKTSGVDRLYHRYVVTRSDHIHAVPHPPLSVISGDNIWFPWGEDYGGLMDRHMVVSRRDLHAALSVLHRVLFDPAKLRAELDPNPWKFPLMNPEAFHYVHFSNNKLLDRVKRFPRTMFTARSDSDGARWMAGELHRDMGVYIKYPAELRHSETNAVSFEFYGRDWKTMLEKVAV